jgi:hypothetical protein
MISVTSTYNATITEGGLKTEYTSSTKRNAYGTIAIPSSGKYYFEAVPHTNAFGGDVGLARYIGQPAANAFSGNDNILYLWNGVWQQEVNGVFTSAGGLATWSVGSAIGVAVNVDAGTVSFYHNGSLQVTRTFNATGLLPYCNDQSGEGDGRGLYLNFGQRPFAYTAPSGFKALCTANLPEPTIADGSTVMDAVLWTGTGTGADRTISGLNFTNAPGFIWGKSRSVATHHTLWDVVRGYGQSNVLSSDETGGQGWTASGRIKTATASSITWEADPGSSWYDGTSRTYVAWCWDAGSSTVSNSVGSITSQVRANASAGFSVVTYTGNGTGGATVGHGGLVNLANGMIIVKRRNSAVNWFVGHGSQGWTKVFEGLNTPAAISTTSGAWNNTSPTSTVFTLGTETSMNGGGGTFVAYCFAPVAGYSSFGSYTGNGSVDGPFVYTGFRPRWILYRRSSNTSDWFVFDTSRLGYNVDNNNLQANSSATESTSNVLDILSNGFKLRTNDSIQNGSGSTYIYAAFAEHPFQYARAR